MSNNKQSSVEWVIENLTLIHALLSRREIGVEFFNRKYNEIVERGKAIHKKEIEQAWKNGDGKFDNIAEQMSLEYYNETFINNERKTIIHTKPTT